MNVLERKRGITLIALVITIITILILAGVSINSIIGKNGIVESVYKRSTRTRKGRFASK